MIQDEGMREACPLCCKPDGLQDGPMYLEGGDCATPRPRSGEVWCALCSWSGREEDLVAVSATAEEDARKERERLHRWMALRVWWAKHIRRSYV